MSIVAFLSQVKAMAIWRFWDITYRYTKRNKGPDIPLATSASNVASMPILPTQRRRALSLLPAANQPTDFFSKLPLELRQHIYDYAFGDRTIHIDLQYGQADTKGHGHAMAFGANPDVDSPWKWRWWSCVCHHDRALSERGLPLHGFWLDCCRRGVGTYCFDLCLPEGECQIGVMGWLQSCRQA